MISTLDNVTLLHYVWKNRTMELVAQKILQVALGSSCFWPCDIDFSCVPPDSKNCIGITFRTLIRIGVIARTNRFKQSESKDSKGRTIFGYVLASRNKAESLLARINPGIKPEGYLV